MSAMEKYVPQDTEIDRIQRIAENFANSGYFQDAREALQAFVKISAGAEMGLQPFVSMSGIAIIKGKPVVGAGILAGLLDDHPDFDYTVTWAPNSTKPTSCTVTVFKNGTERGASSFSMDDAKNAGLAGKDVWKSYTRNMLFARAMSNAVAWYAPSVTRSNGRLYVEGELDDAESTPEPERPRRKRERAAAPPVVEAVDPPETIVDAEIVDAAPDAVATSVESSPPAEDDAAASTIPEPVQAVAVVLKGMAWEQRKLVKMRIEMLGIAWDEQTPAALVAHFAGDDDGLVALLKTNIHGEMPSAEAFDKFISEKDDATLEDVREQMVAAGGFGE